MRPDTRRSNADAAHRPAESKASGGSPAPRPRPRANAGGRCAYDGRAAARAGAVRPTKYSHVRCMPVAKSTIGR